MTHSMMCSSVAHLLEAWHDGELSYVEQIAVEGHLAVCAACSSTIRELRDLQAALHQESLHEERLSEGARDEGTPYEGRTLSLGGGEHQVTGWIGLDAQLGAVSEAILGRLRAERHNSFSARVGRMFEDLHFVWAGLAAFSATAACAAIVASVLHFAPAQRADSLSGVLSALAAPGSDRNPVRLDDGTELPRVNEADVMPAMLVPMPNALATKPVSLAIAGVLTQEGRVRHAAVLPAGEYGDLDARRVMHTVSSTRFRPAQRRGAPVAVNLIWLFEQTTVLGKTGV